MLRHRSVISRLMFAIAGLAVGLFGSEMTFGQLRPEEPHADAVLYSIEVRNDAGDLLYSPMLIGEDGRPVHLNLSGPHSEPMASMALDLDPQVDGENICLGYKLSIDDGFPHSGRVGVQYGAPRSVTLQGGGELLRLSLVVAKAHSPQFERILHHRRRPTT